jgi:hypothetical protein
MITAKPTKSNTELTGEYTKPITTAIPLSDTPASGSGNATLLTTNEAHTDQAINTIPVKPVKKRTEDTDKFAEPITTTTPQGNNLEAGINGTASLTAIEEETHNLQTQTGSTDEVWQSQRNPKSNKVPHSPKPGTSSKQQVETLIENLGNRKRKGGSDDELPHPTTLLLDTIIPWPAKRSRGFTGEYVKPTTTTTHQDDIPAKPGSATTPNRHSPAGSRAHDVASPIDTPRSQPDTKKCIQVGNETYALMSQPRFSYTSHDYDSILVIDSSSPSVPVHSPPTASGKSKKTRTGTRNTHKHSHKF